MFTLCKNTNESFDIKPGELPFFELRDDSDGSIIRAFIQSEAGKTIEIFPGTEDSARYEALMSKRGVKFAKVVIHRK